MTNAELERAKELKHKLDIAYKQMHVLTKELSDSGYTIVFQYNKDSYLDKYSGTESVEDEPKVIVTKTETIEL